MSDFTSGFWSWFVIIMVAVGIGFVSWLLWWQSRGQRPAAGEEVTSVGHVWDEDIYELNNPMPRWWLFRFLLTIAFAVGYLALYPGLGSFPGLLGWSQIKQFEAEQAHAREQYDPIFERYAATPIPELAEDAAARDIGRRLFLTYCATCHGSDARGVPGFPNLTDHDWLWGGTPEQIETSILYGRQGAMPPWQASLSREQIFSVAQYVRSLGGGPIDPVVKLQGEETYLQLCVACHDADGTGNQALGAPNLTDATWLHGASQRTIIDVITNGRTGRMPAHRDFLGEARVHLLAAYIYSRSMLGEER
ncbi:MAG: cytochrome-c oxidase, cbb3-type subunit III [Gammaproteobacteria bacterium]|nr:cytochrome-c oxidase, cbb3-type subunit III [Gammaproteobacteria bacterium]